MENAMAEARLYGHNLATNPKFETYIKRWTDAIDKSARSGLPIPYDGPTAVRSIHD